MRRLNHSELYVVHEKDERYYNQWLNVQQLAQRVLGTKKWLQFRSVISFVSRFAYFGIGDITLGEEFCQSKSDRSYLDLILRNEFNWPITVAPIVKFLKDVNLVTFYLFGDFYELSNRITGTIHITDSNVTGNYLNKLSRFIGILSMIKLLIDLPKNLLSIEEIEQPTKAQSQKESALCQLCSEQRHEPTSTICGHIFCWHCIHQWLKERNECPICRTPTEPSRLIHLMNFR